VPEKVPFGYLYLGFEYPRHALNCMEAIPTDTVITAAQTLLPPIVPWEGVYKPNS
jgi:hypothetical protein